jgi:hypothetical protein
LIGGGFFLSGLGVGRAPNRSGALVIDTSGKEMIFPAIMQPLPWQNAKLAGRFAKNCGLGGAFC